MFLVASSGGSDIIVHTLDVTSSLNNFCHRSFSVEEEIYLETEVHLLTSTHPSFLLKFPPALVRLKRQHRIKEASPSRGPVGMETAVLVNGGFSSRPG